VHVSVPEVRRKQLVLLVAVAFAVAGTAIAVNQVTATPVKTTSKNEVGPAADGDWLAWSRSRERVPSPFDLFARHAGNRAFRVNPKGTQAYAGGIDGTRLVYQLFRGGLAIQSDLRLFDLGTRRQSPLPAGVNTKGWECCGTISGNWLFFSRGHSYSLDTQLIILRNLVTGEQRILDRLRNRNGLLSAGQLNGTFAVWARCNPYPRCQIIRYDLATASVTPLPISAGRVAYAPSVTPRGTAYYLRSSKGCGKSVELVKHTLTGAPQVLAKFPKGRDGDVTYADTVRAGPPAAPLTTHVYFDRTVCSKQTWDIYRVDDVESLPPARAR
jgi:hypothetical protein